MNDARNTHIHIIQVYIQVSLASLVILGDQTLQVWKKRHFRNNGQQQKWIINLYLASLSHFMLPKWQGHSVGLKYFSILYIHFRKYSIFSQIYSKFMGSFMKTDKNSKCFLAYNSTMIGIPALITKCDLPPGWHSLPYATLFFFLLFFTRFQSSLVMKMKESP